MRETTLDQLNLGVFDIREGMRQLHETWGWFLALGVALLFFGVVALGLAGLATWASVVMFGVLVALSGGVQVVHAFSFRIGHGFLLNLLLGVLYSVVGVLMIARPGVGAFSLTMLIAGFLLVGGIFRAVWSAATRFPHWGWSSFSGIVTTALGFYVGSTLPYSALWVIGTFLGVEMVLSGWSWIMLALAAKSYDGRR